MRIGSFVSIMILAAAPALAEPALPQPLGVAPAKARALTDVPNAGAIERIIWAPHLDEGWVPQGMSFAEGSLIVSAYHPKTAERAASCRLFRIDPHTGKETGVYDIAATCGHAGGLAYLGRNRLLVSDTSMLIEIDLAAAFKDGKDAVKRKIPLAGEMRGSYIAQRDGTPWIGTYSRTGDSRIFAVAPDKLTLTRLNDKEASASLPVPPRAQGAAFDRAGQLWISASSSTYGKLFRLDPKDGAVQASFDLPAGTEDLTFDDEGKLWTVSEAGAGSYGFWTTYFPVIFRIDITRLK